MAAIEFDPPVVGADRNTWGTKLNDAMLAAVQAVNESVTDLEVRAGNLIAIHVDDSETDLGPLPIAPGGSDEGVASYIATPGSDTQTALNAQTEQPDILRPTTRFAGRKVITVEGRDFFIKGINLGLNTGSFYDSWTGSWDQSKMFTGIENIAAAGGNTVRIIGHFKAYRDNPAQFKTRFVALMEKARAEKLKVIYSLLCNATAPNDLLNWGTYEAEYKAMFTDLLGDYIADPLIPIIDIGNEMHSADDPNAANFLAIITPFTAWIKTQAPTKLVTASQPIHTYEQAFTRMAALEGIVDVQALHLYLSPSAAHWGKGTIQALVNATAKPMYLNEVGVDAGAVGGGAGPYIGGSRAQASFMRMVSRHLVDADINGIVLWKAFNSTGSAVLMGMFDGAGVAQPQLDEFMKFPDRRLSAVREAIEYRSHPVLLDNFDRTASTSTVGSPDRGPAPTIVSGTWGIRNDPAGGLYVSTKAGSTSDKIVWPAPGRSFPYWGAEFVPQTDLASFGLIWHYTDATNFWFMFASRNGSPTTDMQISVTRVVAGVSTAVQTTVIPGLAAADHPRRFRLAVRVNTTHAYPSVYGIPLNRVALTGGPPATNLVGVLLPVTDSSTYVQAIRKDIEGRIAP